jgi:hypothetical protein
MHRERVERPLEWGSYAVDDTEAICSLGNALRLRRLNVPLPSEQMASVSSTA